MKRDGKQAVISELKELFTANQNFYIADTSGLTVAEVSKLRRMCFKQGVKLKVAKNTLIKKALDSMDGDYSGVYGSLKGTSGLMLCETANVPAKILKDFRKTSERPTLKAAFVESAVFVGDNQIDALANLKSKAELIGEIIGLLQSPAQNVIGALQSSGNKLGGILKTLSERN